MSVGRPSSLPSLPILSCLALLFAVVDAGCATAQPDDGNQAGAGSHTDGGSEVGMPLELGDACGDAMGCASGFCVDGVCCDSPCDGTCEACGSTGLCAAIEGGADPVDECSGDAVCDGVGACAEGDAAWVWSFGDGGQDEVVDVAVDSQGNSVILGVFNGTIQLGDTTHVSVDPFPDWGEDIFVAKVSPTGDVLWSRSYPAAGEQAAAAVAVGPNDEIVLLGDARDQMNFGAGPVPANGRDLFLIKLDAEGGSLWHRLYTDVFSFGSTHARGLAIAPDGSILFAGLIGIATDFGGGAIGDPQLGDIFVARLDENGAHLFSAAYGGAGFDEVSDLAVHEDDVIVVGEYDEAYELAGTMLPPGPDATFVARLGPSGELRWSHAAQLDSISDTAVNTRGDVVVVGSVTEATNLAGADLSPVASREGFFVQLAIDGSVAASHVFHSELSNFAYSVAFDQTDSMLISHGVTGGVFDGLMLPDDFASGTVVSKRDPVGNIVWQHIVNTGFGWLATSPDRSVTWAGRFDTTRPLELGGGMLQSNGSSDAFIAKLQP